MANELDSVSHSLNHMPQGTLSCYAIHLEGHEGHQGTISHAIAVKCLSDTVCDAERCRFASKFPTCNSLGDLSGLCGEKTRLLLAAAVMMMTPAFANPESQRSLGPCPDSPNCVSSQSSDLSHFIEPFRLTVAPERGWDALKAVLQAIQRVKIVEDSGGYMHAEATSRVFRFVDDMEFLMRPDGQLIDVRSASRVGYSDFGVNRRRIERIRQELMADVEP